METPIGPMETRSHIGSSSRPAGAPKLLQLLNPRLNSCSVPPKVTEPGACSALSSSPPNRPNPSELSWVQSHFILSCSAGQVASEYTR